MNTDPKPFLPEPDPEPPKPKSASKRTLLLWGLLVMMFFAIWQLLSPSPSGQTGQNGHHARPPLPPCEHVWTFTDTLTSVGPMVFLGLMFFVFLRSYGASTRFNREAEAGLVALAERRLASATEIFERVIAANAAKPAYASIARLNLAYTQISAGQLVLAKETLAKIERTLGLLRNTGVRPIVAQELAFVHALTGELDVADRWSEDGRKRLAATHDARPYAAAKLCLAEAIVKIRRGDSLAAVAMLEKNWLVLRAVLSANPMRTAEVIRAFAEVGGGVRQYNVVQERLIRVEPVIGDEFAFLGVQWPEMKTFLEAHRLVRGTAGTS